MPFFVHHGPQFLRRDMSPHPPTTLFTIMQSKPVKFQWSYIIYQPGLASTEVEHSLRKIFVQGDRGSILAEDSSFQTLSFFQIFAQMFDGISNYQTSYNLAASIGKSCCDFSLFEKGTYLQIGPMM